MPKSKKEGSQEIRKASVVEDKLVQNLVELQKIHIILIEKMDRLANQVSSLLNIFELAAKNIAERPTLQEVKAMNERIDSLTDQNKTIAKGLTMLEPKSPQSTVPPVTQNNSVRPKTPEDEFKPSINSRPLPKL